MLVSIRVGTMQSVIQPKIQLSKEEIRNNKPARYEYLTKPKIPLVLVLDHVTNSYNIGALSVWRMLFQSRK